MYTRPQNVMMQLSHYRVYPISMSEMKR